MNLICPNCKETFEVNESHYAALLSQVKNKEFEKELQRRIEEIESNFKEREKTLTIESERKVDLKVAENAIEREKLLSEIKNLQSKIDSYSTQKDAEIAKLSARNSVEFSKLEKSKNDEILSLKEQIKEIRSQRELEIANVHSESLKQLFEHKQKITLLESDIKSQKLATENKLREINEQHSAILKAKDEQIEHYRDMKLKLSTKMLGETLEQHCLNLFVQHQSLGLFPNAIFEKDNDIHPGGTKGDFIFRDYFEDEEYISIMFEMKNEADATVTKHKNSHFFEKLDKDRREKKCEYAILVSMLEQENETYNTGIVNVSGYEKMYVIRPQMFIQIIAILTQNAKRNLQEVTSLRNQLRIAQAQSVDVTNFEQRRNKFGEEFSKWVGNAAKKHQKAIDDIDKAIDNLEKQITLLRGIRTSFEESDKYLSRANEKFETDFTIKKLTRGNATMKAKFDEARKLSSNSEEQE